MWIETVFRDIRYGARIFSRQPATTILAVFTLSLGLGANVVLFSLLHALLIRPLPLPDGDRLVAVVDNFRIDGASNVPPTVPELIDVRASSHVFESLSFFDMRDVQIMGGTEPLRAFAARIEASFLTTLGVRPALGRLFVEGENTPGRDRVVILTDSFWRTGFGGDPAIINRPIIVNGASHIVVGVLPPDFSFDYLAIEPIEIYVPFSMIEAYTSRAAEFANVRRVTAVARLKRGVTATQASAEVQTISHGIARAHPALYRRGSDRQDVGFSMGVVPLKEIVVGRARSFVLLLFGAVGLLLLIACVNTAQFLLARALDRHQEVAVRIALGAGRGRLLRQFVAEASLLAVVGVAAGLLQAAWLMSVLRVMLSRQAPFLGQLAINGWVMAFAIGLAMLVTVLCGLFPAIHLSRPAQALRVAGTTGGVRSRARQMLIASEVAVSIVLLVCAGVLVQGIRQLERAPRGYSTDDVTLMRMRLASRGAAIKSGPIYQQYLEQISAIPGIRAAAVADAPLHGPPGVEFAVIGQAEDAATLSQQLASWRIVSPQYFAAAGVPILEGRSFADDDIVGRLPVAIINEEMAHRFWPGESAIGRQIRSGAGPRSATTTIVGVVGNVRPLLQRDAGFQIYVSYLQQSEPNVTLLVRTAPGSAAPVPAIKQAVQSIVPDQPFFAIRPMAEAMQQQMSQPRLVSRLLAGFALVAVLMSIVGVYTLIAYVTARRTKEVALRRAIGANSLDVFRLLTMQTMFWTAAGLTVGLIGAAAATNVLRSAVLGAARLDIGTTAAIGTLYLAVVAIAVSVPAWRALRISPASVLRRE